MKQTLEIKKEQYEKHVHELNMQLDERTQRYQKDNNEFKEMKLKLREKNGELVSENEVLLRKLTCLGESVRDDNTSSISVESPDHKKLSN